MKFCLDSASSNGVINRSSFNGSSFEFLSGVGNITYDGSEYFLTFEDSGEILIDQTRINIRLDRKKDGTICSGKWAIITSSYAFMDPRDPQLIKLPNNINVRVNNQHGVLKLPEYINTVNNIWVWSFFYKDLDYIKVY